MISRRGFLGSLAAAALASAVQWLPVRERAAVAPPTVAARGVVLGDILYLAPLGRVSSHAAPGALAVGRALESTNGPTVRAWLAPGFGTVKGFDEQGLIVTQSVVTLELG